jgi:uncharacterized protein (TIGR02145 family)
MLLSLFKLVREFLLSFIICLGVSLYLVQHVYSQTNIELFIDNKISHYEMDFLDRVTFLNGDSLKRITDISNWQDTRKKSNVPAVFVYERTNENGNKIQSYLYNYYALTDPRGLIPYTKEIPELINNNFSLTCGNIKLASKNTFYRYIYGDVVILPQPVIEPNDNSPNRFELYVSSNSFSIWGPNGKSNHIEFANSFSLNCNYDKLEISTSNDIKSSALPILVVNSKKAILESKDIWNYDEIMPITSKRYDSELFSLLYSINTEKTGDFIYHATWYSNEMGNSFVKDIYVNNRKNNTLQSKIEETISKWDNIPCYNGYFIPSRKVIEINLDLKRTKKKLFLNEFNSSSILNDIPKNTLLHSSKARSVDYNFKYIYYELIINGKLNDLYLKSEKIVIPKKVRAEGYVNSLLSIFPGAGVSAITRKSPYYYHNRVYKNTFLISTSTLLTTILISNNIRNHYHKSYQTTTYFSESQKYYQKANTANKIFITSLSAYSILALIDFSFTISIARKNKSFQRNINIYFKENAYSEYKYAALDKTINETNNIVIEQPEKESHIPISINTYNMLFDTRDGNKYKTVKIGNQVWMAENLAFKPNYGDYWAYDNKLSNVVKYGYLYDWKTACKVCPNGWHLPSIIEWRSLKKSIGTSNTGANMKSQSGWSNNGNGSNTTGFSAYPGGYRYDIGTFGFIGDGGFWWSSSDSDINTIGAWGVGLYFNDGDIHYFNDVKKSGFSVRCIKD